MITALVDRPHEINTKTGNLGALAHTLAPKTAFRVLHVAYQVFPDSSAARGDSADARTEKVSVQKALSRAFRACTGSLRRSC